MKSDVEEIVEELPEDADLSTDPGHSEQLLAKGEATPPQASTVPASSDVGPDPVLVTTSDSLPESPPQSVETPVPELDQTPVLSPEPEPPSPLPDVQSPVLESEESSRAGSKAERNEDECSLSSEMSGAVEEKAAHKYATLSRVRKFKVDGQVVESTTRKIVDVTDNKTLLRDNKKYQQMR